MQNAIPDNGMRTPTVCVCVCVCARARVRACARARVCVRARVRARAGACEREISRLQEGEARTKERGSNSILTYLLTYSMVQSLS